MAAIPDNWRAFFATAVYTGLRKGELIGLRVTDIDLQRRIISVEHSYSTTTKSKKYREVPVVDELLSYIQARMAQGVSEYLFPRHNGGMLTRHCSVNHVMRTALKRAGLISGYKHICRRHTCRYREFSPDSGVGKRKCPRCGYTLLTIPVPIPLTLKDLRSTLASHMARATKDLRFVQKLLGHSDLCVTEEHYDAFVRGSSMVELANQLKYNSDSLTPKG